MIDYLLLEHSRVHEIQTSGNEQLIDLLGRLTGAIWRAIKPDDIDERSAEIRVEEIIGISGEYNGLTAMRIRMERRLQLIIEGESLLTGETQIVYHSQRIDLQRHRSDFIKAAGARIRAFYNGEAWSQLQNGDFGKAYDNRGFRTFCGEVGVILDTLTELLCLLEENKDEQHLNDEKRRDKENITALAQSIYALRKKFLTLADGDGEMRIQACSVFLSASEDVGEILKLSQEI